MNNAALAIGGGDPRDPNNIHRGSIDAVETQLGHATHDPNVTFEEYVYYAAITRAEEKADYGRMTAVNGPRTFKSTILNRFSKGKTSTPDSPVDQSSATEKNGLDEKGITHPNGNHHGNHMRVTDSEWRNASRAVRTAGWSGVFYLITTDILGPFSVPWAFAQVRRLPSQDSIETLQC